MLNVFRRRRRVRRSSAALVRLQAQDGSVVFLEVAKQLLLVTPSGGVFRASIPAQLRCEALLIDWAEIHSWMAELE